MNKDSLTAREREILALVAQGKTNAEVAAVLWVAPGTVKKHIENIMLNDFSSCSSPAFGSYVVSVQ